MGQGQRRPARAARRRARASISRRDSGAWPTRRPTCTTAARRASTTRSPATTARAPPRARRSRRCRCEDRGPLRVYLMSLRRAPRVDRARDRRAPGAAQHVQVEHADAGLAVDRMAERADQQRRAAASVGIGRAADVPSEPAVAPRRRRARSAPRRFARSGARRDRPGRPPSRRCQGAPIATSSTPSPSRSPAATTIRPNSSPGWRPDQCRSSFPVRAGVDAKPRPGALRVWSSVAGRRHRDLALAVAVEIARPPPRRRRSRRGGSVPCPVVQLLAARRREDPGAADPRAVGVRCRRCADGEIGAAVAVEIVEAGDVPSEGRALFARRVGPQHRAVLAAQEIDATAVLRGRTDEEVGAPVAVLVAGQRQVPAEVLARRSRSRFQSSSPVLGERATTMPRTAPADAARAAPR